MSNVSGYNSKQILDGVSLYKTNDSPYWKARVWLRKKKKYVTQTTKTKNRIEATEIANQFAKEVLLTDIPNDEKLLFSVFAERMNKANLKLSKSGELSESFVSNETVRLYKPGGIVDVFGDLDLSQAKPSDINKRMDKVYGGIAGGNPKPSSRNLYLTTVKKVFTFAVTEGAIDRIPQFPKSSRNASSNQPRVGFEFTKSNNEWEKIRKGTLERVGKTLQLRKTGNTFHNLKVGEDFYDLLMLLMHSFVRATEGEIFSIRHSDIEMMTDPRRLVIRVSGGKTGVRYVDTLPASVSAYERILERRGNCDPQDFILYPEIQNRKTLQRKVQRTFRAILIDMNLLTDRDGNERSLYSLRHTSIQMRLVNSEGEVNIYNLARNCGTSVEMIERFYAKFPPNTPEFARNIQAMKK